MQSSSPSAGRRTTGSRKFFSVLGIACALNALLVGAFVWKAWPNVTAEPDLSRVGDVAGDLDAIFREGMEGEEENAWPAYERIGRSFADLDEDFKQQTGRLRQTGALSLALQATLFEWTPPARTSEESDVAESLTVVRGHKPFTDEELELAWSMVQPLAEQVEAASRLPVLAPDIWERGSTRQEWWVTSNVNSGLHDDVPYILWGAIGLAMRQARWDDAIRWLETCRRVSNQEGSTSVNGMLRAAVMMNGALASLHQAIHHYEIDPESAQRLLDILESYEFSMDVVDRALRSSVRVEEARAARHFDRRGRMMIWERYMLGWSTYAHRFRVLQSTKDTVGARLLNAFVFDMPRWDDVIREYQNELEASREFWRGWKAPYPMLDSIFVGETTFQKELGTRSMRRALWSVRARFEPEKTVLRVMLRLEMYHARYGEWPAELVDAMAKEETIDPITGRPFVYERTLDDAERPYLVKTTAAPLPSWAGKNPILNHDP